MTCNGYYGSSHGQPVCPTCHAFLYANDIDEEVNLQLLSEERRQRNGDDSDRDSGNEEMDAAGAGGAAQLPLQAQEPREQHPDQEFNPDLSKFIRKKIWQKNNISLIQCTSSITKKKISGITYELLVDIFYFGKMRGNIAKNEIASFKGAVRNAWMWTWNNPKMDFFV